VSVFCTKTEEQIANWLEQKAEILDGDGDRLSSKKGLAFSIGAEGKWVAAESAREFAESIRLGEYRRITI
jgi:hypothetical protein